VHKLSESFGYNTHHNELPLSTRFVTERLMWLLVFEFIDNEWKHHPERERKFPPQELIERWREGVSR